MFRNRNIETGFERSLVCIFIVHSALFAGILIKQGAAFDNTATNGLEIVLEKIVIVLGAAFNLLEAFIGILALGITPGFIGK